MGGMATRKPGAEALVVPPFCRDNFNFYLSRTYRDFVIN